MLTAFDESDREEHPMTTTIDLNEEKLQAFLERAFADLAACYGGVMVRDRKSVV